MCPRIMREREGKGEGGRKERRERKNIQISYLKFFFKRNGQNVMF